jgi:hypothetical protein
MVFDGEIWSQLAKWEWGALLYLLALLLIDGGMPLLPQDGHHGG